MHEFMADVIWSKFGQRIHDRAHCIALFERHNEEVMRTIPKERLLVYEVSEGWPPLCQFLDVPVPDAPFPRTNSTENFLGRRRLRETQG